MDDVGIKCGKLRRQGGGETAEEPAEGTFSRVGEKYGRERGLLAVVPGDDAAKTTVIKALGLVSVEYANLDHSTVMKRLKHISEVLNLVGKDKSDAWVTVHADGENE